MTISLGGAHSNIYISSTPREWVTTPGEMVIENALSLNSPKAIPGRPWRRRPELVC